MSSALGLGAVQGQVGIPQQFIRTSRISGRHGNTDADADRDLVAVEVERSADRFDEARRERTRVFGMVHLGLQDREFVAAQPRKHLAGAQALRVRTATAAGVRHPADVPRRR